MPNDKILVLKSKSDSIGKPPNEGKGLLTDVTPANGFTISTIEFSETIPPTPATFASAFAMAVVPE